MKKLIWLTFLLSILASVGCKLDGSTGSQGPAGTAGVDGANGADGGIGPRGLQGDPGADDSSFKVYDANDTYVGELIDIRSTGEKIEVLLPAKTYATEKPVYFDIEYGAIDSPTFLTLYYTDDNCQGTAYVDEGGFLVHQGFSIQGNDGILYAGVGESVNRLILSQWMEWIGIDCEVPVTLPKVMSVYDIAAIATFVPPFTIQ